jgi:hypothetical protein
MCSQRVAALEFELAAATAEPAVTSPGAAFVSRQDYDQLLATAEAQTTDLKQRCASLPCYVCLYAMWGCMGLTPTALLDAVIIYANIIICHHAIRLAKAEAECKLVRRDSCKIEVRDAPIHCDMIAICWDWDRTGRWCRNSSDRITSSPGHDVEMHELN